MPARFYSIWNTVNDQWAHAYIPDIIWDDVYDLVNNNRRTSTAYNPIFLPAIFAKQWLYHRRSRSDFPARFILRPRPTNWKSIATRMNHALKFL